MKNQFASFTTQKMSRSDMKETKGGFFPDPSDGGGGGPLPFLYYCTSNPSIIYNSFDSCRNRCRLGRPPEGVIYQCLIVSV